MMEFSDLISLLEIVFSFVVGFYLVHWYSVRDSRNQVLKESFLSNLTKIQGLTDDLFESLQNGKLNWKNMISNISYIDRSLEGFDRDLRVAFPFKRKELQLLIGDITDELTNLEFINNQSRQRHFNVPPEKKGKVRELGLKAHSAFCEYLAMINESPSYGVLHRLKTNYINSVDFYRTKKAKHPQLKTLRDLLCLFAFRLLIVIVIILFSSYIIYRYTTYSKVQEESLLNEQKWKEQLLLEIKDQNRLIDSLRVHSSLNEVSLLEIKKS